MAKKVWYKIVGPKGEAVNGGHGTWNLPKGKKPGDWMPMLHSVIVCSSGYHLVPGHGISAWGEGGRLLFVAEGRSSKSGPSGSDGKTAFAEARLLRLVGVFPKGFTRFKPNGGTKSEADVLAEVKDPKKYAAKLKREADAKKKAAAKLKAEETHKKAAFRKKYGHLRAAVTAGRRNGVSYTSFTTGYLMAKGMTYKAARKFSHDNWSYLN